MIFRRFNRGHVTKLVIRFFSIHRVFFPWTEATVRSGTIRHHLSYKLRGSDYMFYNARGDSIDDWLNRYGRGCYVIEVGDMYEDVVIHPQICTIKIRFTDRNTAIMFKLQMGGM